MPYAEITSDVLNHDLVMEKVRSTANGGYVSFSGDVRESDNGKKVSEIDYHCYQDLALKEIQKIVADAESNWHGAICAVAHRVGIVKVGESSVIICVSAPHRAEAFEACRWIIDTLKTTVPIWKREQFVGENSVWIEGDQHIDAKIQ